MKIQCVADDGKVIDFGDLTTKSILRLAVSIYDDPKVYKTLKAIISSIEKCKDVNEYDPRISSFLENEDLQEIEMI